MQGILQQPTHVIPEQFSTGSTLSIPVEWLIKLHNAAAIDSPVRAQIKDYVTAYGSANEKAHWTRALVVDDFGELKLDARLLDVAIYRGKQETYIKGAQQAFKELQFQLKMIAGFQKDEEVSHALLQGVDLRGTSLLPLRAPSDMAMQLQAGSKALNITVERMALGMAESLASPNVREASGTTD